jgi:hypothetical protein
MIDEQKSEIEMIQSIFFDEIIDIEQKQQPFTLKIKINPRDDEHI